MSKAKSLLEAMEGSIDDQIAKGKEVEKEHHESLKKTLLKYLESTIVEEILPILEEGITLDHLGEDDLYYDHLKEMEDKYKKKEI